MILFFLSKLNINLSVAEVESQFGEGKLIDDLLLVRTKKKNFERLAYIKEAHRFIFCCSKEDFISRIKNFNWNKVYGNNFSVNLNGKSKYNQKELGKYVWRSLVNPKVKLKGSDTQIYFSFRGDSVYASLKVFENTDDFESRKPHKRPGLMPISLHPRLGKAMVNMTSINKGVIFDPCCGTGGLLIEAGLIGHRVVGFDIDQRMIDRSYESLRYFKIVDYKLECRDSLLNNLKFNFIVSDLPYGKNTKSISMERFYFDFFLMLKRCLGKKAVISIPQGVDLKIPRGLKIIGDFDYYIHRSLSKRILIIETFY